ncbi:MAG: TlpA disulfide reductase family protein [Eubacteriales bacterium]|nr:TlpA disulfide reductase family protein [Eubacteriales bacterium]
MKKIVSVILIIVLCLGMSACSSKETEKESETEAAKGLSAVSSFPESVPAFSTVDLEGNTVTNDIFSQAELTVINFWATFCNPCINEMPELEDWAKDMPEGVQIIGIIVDVSSQDSDEYAAALQIVEKTGVTYQNLLPTEEFDDIIGELVGVPTTFFVDRDGAIVGEPIIGANVEGYKQYVEDYFDEQK